MMIITSPANQKKLDHYKEISARLAHAEGLTDDQAHALAREGKAVVWIDGGLHASETVGSQQLMEMVYQMASRTDPETMRLLDDVIQLYVQANPDGQEMVANWYMREKDPLKRSMNGMPMLYAKYVGHDDNRDFYMSAMKETTNMNHQLFLEWYPQIMYNHHQTGPAGAVIFMPPFPRSFQLQFRSAWFRWESRWWARRCTAAWSPRAKADPRCAPARIIPRGGTAVCGRSRISTT